MDLYGIRSPSLIQLVERVAEGAVDRGDCNVKRWEQMPVAAMLPCVLPRSLHGQPILVHRSKEIEIPSKSIQATQISQRFC